MVVITIGMPRSGSGWRFSLINDIVMASGWDDVHDIRKGFFLQPFLTEVNCNINTLKAKRLIPVLLPSFLGKKYIINTHSGPYPFCVKQVQNRRIKAIYGYRDPRAAMISVLEYSQRAKESYSADFLEVKSVDDAIDYMLPYLEGWRNWQKVKNLFNIKYEDMLTNFNYEIKRMLDYLDIDHEDPEVRSIIMKYIPGQVPEGKKQGMHFQVGNSERFRQVLSAEDLSRANERFKPYLEEMGYEI